jgi:hypothetical protein
MSHPLADPDQLRPYTTTADPVEAYFVVESDKYSSKTFIRRRLGAKFDFNSKRYLSQSAKNKAF